MTIVTELAFFQGLTESELEPVREAVTGVVSVREGEVVCAEGSIADRWWIVAEGLADVTVEGLYTATVGPGESIGELSLLDGLPRSATVSAVTDMCLHEVDGYAFLDALYRSPELSLALLRQLAGRLRSTNRRPSRPERVVAATVGRVAVVDPVYDPAVPGFYDDPESVLQPLREAGPLHWSPVLSSWVVTRYEDVHRLVRSRSLVGSVPTFAPPPEPGPDGAPPTPRPGHRMMINKDGDDHTALRRLVSKVFTPRAISDWSSVAEGIVERLLASLADQESSDLIADYALPLPAQIITTMLGLPAGDTEQLRAWSQTLVMTLDPVRSPDEDASIADAGRAFGNYLFAAVAEKRSSLGQDILSDLLRTGLDERDIVAQVLMLYIAGHETTLNLIANGVISLFRFPSELALMRSDPDLDANAIEEVLRYEGPAQVTRRIAVEPVMIGDTELPAGTHLTLLLSSANRDPRKWGPTADVLDLARPGANEHVAFGGGPHHCLGASLARLEARIALPRLVRRFPAMASAYESLNWTPRLGLRGVASLPVTLR